MSPQLREALTAEIERLKNLDDPLEAMLSVGDFFAELDFELEKVAEVRLEAFADLRREGWTYNRLIEATGLSKTRISQLSDQVRNQAQARRR